jgi:hypothetical protein
VAEDLKEVIRENAAGLKTASGDQGSATQHDLSQQIEADRYLSSRSAAQKPHRALRMTKLIPPGSA